MYSMFHSPITIHGSFQSDFVQSSGRAFIARILFAPNNRDTRSESLRQGAYARIGSDPAISGGVQNPSNNTIHWAVPGRDLLSGLGTIGYERSFRPLLLGVGIHLLRSGSRATVDLLTHLPSRNSSADVLLLIISLFNIPFIPDSEVAE